MQEENKNLPYPSFPNYSDADESALGLGHQFAGMKEEHGRAVAGF